MTQPSTLNPYPYVLNNPLKYVDPTGLILGPSLTDREIEKQLERTKKYTNYGNMVRTPASNSNAVGIEQSGDVKRPSPEELEELQIGFLIKPMLSGVNVFAKLHVFYISN